MSARRPCRRKASARRCARPRAISPRAGEDRPRGCRRRISRALSGAGAAAAERFRHGHLESFDRLWVGDDLRPVGRAGPRAGGRGGIRAGAGRRAQGRDALHQRRRIRHAVRRRAREFRLSRRGASSRHGRNGRPAAGFALFGPTCDSFDHLPGPFMLPADIGEGDYIEIGNIGAYGHVMASPFNGFGKYERVRLADAPMMSMYALRIRRRAWPTAAGASAEPMALAYRRPEDGFLGLPTARPGRRRIGRCARHPFPDGGHRQLWRRTAARAGGNHRGQPGAGILR